MAKQNYKYSDLRRILRRGKHGGSVTELLDFLKDNEIEVKVITLPESFTYKKKIRIKPRLLGKKVHKNLPKTKKSMFDINTEILYQHGYIPKTSSSKRRKERRREERRILHLGGEKAFNRRRDKELRKIEMEKSKSESTRITLVDLNKAS